MNWIYKFCEVIDKGKYNTKISFIVCSFLGLIGALIIINILGTKIYLGIAFLIIGITGMFFCLDFWINVKRRIKIPKEAKKKNGIKDLP